MAEGIGEGDLLHFDVEVLLSVHGTKSTVESFTHETKMSVDFGQIVHVFENLSVSFKFDNKVLSSVFAFIGRVGVVLDLLRSLFVEGVEVHDGLEDVHVTLHVLFDSDFVEFIPVAQGNDFGFFGAACVGFRVAAEDRLFGTVSGFQNTVTIQEVVVAKLIFQRSSREQGQDYPQGKQLCHDALHFFFKYKFC
jgi:hypothetical protein